jgi:PAS domain S-box-containing protein
MDNLDFIPIDREIQLAPDKSMVYKLTPDGVIDYVNDYFVEISGYEVHEIVGNTLESLKNSDLPTIIYNMIIEYIENNKNLNIILKGYAKDGRFYWYVTNFEAKKDENGELTATIVSRIAAPRMAIPKIEKLYVKLLKIEQHASLAIAKTFFDGFLEEEGMSFNDYSIKIINNTYPIQSAEQFPPKMQKQQNPKKKKSLIGKFFGK